MSDLAVTLGVVTAKVQAAVSLLGDQLPIINVTIHDEVVSILVDEATYRLKRQYMSDIRRCVERINQAEYKDEKWVHLYLDINPSLVLHTCFRDGPDASDVTGYYKERS